MKPSTALTMIESLTVALGAAERRSDELRSTRLDILARLDRGEDLSAVGQIAADAIGAAVFDATFAESDEPAQPKPDDAPYGRRSDGSPKARPGRKAKEAPSRETIDPSGGPRPVQDFEAAKAPVDEVKNAAPPALSVDEAARALVDQERNGRELRAISAALSLGPLTVDELALNSGVSRDNIDRHLAARAVVEEYEGSRGPGFRDLTLVRLITQRPS